MGISKGRGKSCCIFFFSFCFVTMKFFALIACLAVASAYDQAWEDYKLEFNKLYTAAEELTRYANWKKQSEDVDLHNAMYGHEFTLAINELSDLSEEEYQKIYLSGLRVPKGPSNATMYVPTSDAIPNAVDWSEEPRTMWILLLLQCYWFPRRSMDEVQRKSPKLGRTTDRRLLWTLR